MKKVSIILVILISIFASLGNAQDSDELKKIFNSKHNYDIYYQVSDDSINVITDVEIYSIKTIGGKQFLECYSDSFGKFAKDDRSFIDFQSIRAIHPNKTFVKTVFEKEK